MRTVSERAESGRQKARTGGDVCAQCGAPVEETNVLHCGDCHFVYCVDHAEGDAHLCAVICRECVELDEAH